MSQKELSNRQKNAQQLAEGYTWQKRAVEISSITLFFVGWFLLLIQTARFFVHNPRANSSYFVPCFISALLGILLADFISGLAHWGFDTWGSTDTPGFGVLIRSFREHHVDQTSITRHDFVETNGDNMMPCVPFIWALYFLNPFSPDAAIFNPSFYCWFLTATIAIAFTNQTHKSAHQVKQPPVIRELMQWGILLSPQHHRVHHSGEFERHYCITTGWLNKPLDAIGFWRWAEDMVTKVTGAIPRANDKELLAE